MTSVSGATAGSSSASDTGAAYAPYYRANGTATLQAGVTLKMVATDFSFAPNTLLAKAGVPAELAVDNTSSEAHDISLAAFGVHATLPAGTVTTVRFTPTRAGTYTFWCDLPGHAQAGMVGRLTVS